MDLTSDALPQPRLKPDPHGVVWVPAFTDLKLHDITNGPADPNAEPLDQNQPAGSPGFFAGNTKFITRKLWGVANSAPFLHHGKFTTMREAVLAHSGEAKDSREGFERLSPYERDCVVEFLKTLLILPPDVRAGKHGTGEAETEALAPPLDRGPIAMERLSCALAVGSEWRASYRLLQISLRSD